MTLLHNFMLLHDIHLLCFHLGLSLACLWKSQNQLMLEAIAEMQKKVGACLDVSFSNCISSLVAR